MRTLHFDCFSGLSGDMTLAALLDAGADQKAVEAAFASFELPIRLNRERVKRNGISATSVQIYTEDQENQRHLRDILEILDKGEMTVPARMLAKQIFQNLGEAEAKVHGIPLEKVHFHEVGALDSIADIAGVAIAWDSLKIQQASSRSVPPGSGTVKCDHGLMPIPAPATAELLKGMPLAKAPITGELVTPTGAAILKTLVQHFCEQPEMTIESIGWGAGQRDYWEQPNCLRVLIGETKNQQLNDTIWELQTNLDDVPGEIVGYTIERLWACGARDVFTMPIAMKKNRPGVLLTVLCTPADKKQIEECLFVETGTLGIRAIQKSRVILPRETITLETSYGPVRFKQAEIAGVSEYSPEYDDCARIAREKQLPLIQVISRVQDAIRQAQVSGSKRAGDTV